jgi:hypothetical protein
MIVAIIFFFLNTAQAQEKVKLKYGDVKPQDFVKNYAIDSTAEAVVLFDKGITSINGWGLQKHQLEFERHRRVHILGNGGLDEGTINEILYIDGRFSMELSEIKGTSYNLVNGKIEKTELISENKFIAKLNKYYQKVSLVLPNVKVGSIIEIKYKIKSPFIYNLPDWRFQENIPVLYSELNTYIPDFVEYASTYQGNSELTTQTKEEKYLNLGYEGKDKSSNSRVILSIYAAENLPALTKEKFSTTSENYVTKMIFKLSKWINDNVQTEIKNDWNSINENFYDNNGYKEMFDVSDKNIASLIPTIGLLPSDNLKTKVNKIVAYVRQNFRFNGEHNIYFSNNINNILETKLGTSGELNALLIKLLNTVEIPCSPVLLSTRENGFINSYFPNSGKFNRLIGVVYLEGRPIYLDASDEHLPFGAIKPSYINGYSRIINKKGEAIQISADSIRDKNLINVKMSQIGDKIIGKMEYRFGLLESYEKRKKSDLAGLLTSFGERISSDIMIEKTSCPNFDKIDEAIIHNIQYKMNFPVEDSFIYVDPFIFSEYRKNPFNVEKRDLPIELEYLKEDNYVFSLEIPQGYIIEEIPISASISIDDANSITFEYRVSATATNIGIRSKIKINKSTYPAGSYKFIRDQFDLISQKLNEQLVLRKI